jgi:deazaflavin-dependent oxidoreductase (nitroreductase family)
LIAVFDWLFKLFVKLQIAVFRTTNGNSLSSMRGMPFLLLNTVGRKTGKPRTTPLMYIRDGDDYVITASNSGRDWHPAWFINLQARPLASIDVPGRRLDITASIVAAEAYPRLWQQLVSQAPFFDGYRKSTKRHIPMLVLKPR